VESSKVEGSAAWEDKQTHSTTPREQ